MNNLRSWVVYEVEDLFCMGNANTNIAYEMSSCKVVHKQLDPFERASGSNTIGEAKNLESFYSDYSTFYV